MTTTTSSEALPCAVASLQGLLSKHTPGSLPYSIAERALDLAFNGPPLTEVAGAQDLLAEAERLIKRQMRACLLSGPSQPKVEVLRKAVFKPANPIHSPQQRELFAWKIQQAVPRILRLAAAVKTRGDGHAFLC